MSRAFILIRRNIKLFFKDKGMFLSSLISPVVLLVLYATFLGNVFRRGFSSGIPSGVKISENILDGLVGGQLISSILAVSCVTVAFCSNILMIQDKASGTIKDLKIAPIKASTISLSYYMATFISTTIMCFISTVACIAYISMSGLYISLTDIVLLLGDVILLVLFGTGLSSILHFFLSTQGQMAAVGVIISSGYGFICGAYMPIASFSKGLRDIILLFPGTYGTSLIRNHAMRGVFAALEKENVPANIIQEMKDGLDFNLYFQGNKVDMTTMYLVIGLAIIGLIGIYVALNKIRK